MTLREQVIEALKELCGFDLDLEPDEAKRLYELNIQSLTNKFQAAIEAEREECAKILRDAAVECRDKGNFPRFENLMHYAQLILARDISPDDSRDLWSFDGMDDPENS